MTRSDVASGQALEDAVRRRLERDENAHVRLLARYEVAVLAGEATLTGHVRSRQTARAMAATAARVTGVSSVDDQLVADDELVAQVASAIGRSPLNRGSRLVVRSELGHVRIGGVYPSSEAQSDALRIGAGQPGVLTATPSRPSDLLG